LNKWARGVGLWSKTIDLRVGRKLAWGDGMYCPKCGNELPDGSIACNACGARLLPRKNLLRRVLIGSASIAVLLIAILLILNYQKTQRFNARLEEAVGKDMGYTETIMKIESEASSMSFAELFDLCEKSVEGRTSLVVELRGLYPDVESELKNRLIEFLNEENNLVRQKGYFYRKLLAFSTTMELYKDHVVAYPTSSYGWDYYNQRTRQLKSEMTKASADMVESAASFIVAYRSLVEMEQELEKRMASAGLRFATFFKQYEKENIDRAQAAIDAAGKAQE
jgi:hypothetical protein